MWLPGNVTHKLIAMGWDCLARKYSSVAMVTHSLLVMVMGWNIATLMRLPGKEIKQCHSQAVGLGMRHNWWGCLGIMSLTSYLSWDETAWQGNQAVLITSCWSWDETWSMGLPGNVTHMLLVIGWNCLARNKAVSLTTCWSWDEAAWQRNKVVSLTCCCGHGMRHDGWVARK